MEDLYDVHNEVTDSFFDAVLSLKTREECYRFFEDVCTVKELLAIAQRLEVARLLEKGMTFSVIAEKTGASTATIARVNRCIRYGTGGYRMVMEVLRKND